MELWVQRAIQGDHEAFVSLICSLELSLYRVARSILSNDEDCADALQETIMRAYESIHQVKKSMYFKTWITRILINQCKQILAERKKTVSIIERQEVADQSDAYEKVDMKELVNQLDESLRLVITLYYYGKYPLQEIAEIMDIPKGTVKSRLHRARNELAQLMKKTSPQRRVEV